MYYSIQIQTFSLTKHPLGHSHWLTHCRRSTRARPRRSIRSDRTPRPVDFSGGFLVPREPAERAVGRSARLVGWFARDGRAIMPCQCRSLPTRPHRSAPTAQDDTPQPVWTLDMPQRRDNERIGGRVIASSFFTVDRWGQTAARFLFIGSGLIGNR